MFQGVTYTVTMAIAIYGAFLATLSFILSIILAIIEVRRHLPLVIVSVNQGVITDAIGKTSEPLIIMKAINRGSGSISLTGVGWYLRDGSKKQFMTPYLLQLPYLLPERRSCCTFFPCRAFRAYADNRQFKTAFFQDETGKIWKGKISRKKRMGWLRAKYQGLHIY